MKYITVTLNPALDMNIALSGPLATEGLNRSVEMVEHRFLKGFISLEFVFPFHSHLCALPCFFAIIHPQKAICKNISVGTGYDKKIPPAVVGFFYTKGKAVVKVDHHTILFAQGSAHST